MSEEQAHFLKPRLVGSRFEGASIPLEVLRDLAVFEEMVIEVAKWHYFQRNPDRKRSPRGFTDGVSLKLVGIEDGSAKPVIDLVIAAFSASVLFGGSSDPRQQYFDEARDSIVGVVHAAETNTLKDFKFPSESLGYFDRLGRSLRPGEAMEITSPSSNKSGTLTRETRRKLLLFSPDVTEFTEEARVWGSIPEFDQVKRTCSVQLLDNRRISMEVTAQHFKTVMDAFTGYKSGVKVLIQGVGTYNRNNHLSGFQSIEHLTQLEPLDVTARLEELRMLKKGWLNGDGVAIDSNSLSWLIEAWDTNYKDELPLPHAYPTPGGGVQFEWTLHSNEMSLEVCLPERRAVWHDLELDEEENLDLNNQAAWEWIAARISKIDKGNE